MGHAEICLQTTNFYTHINLLRESFQRLLCFQMEVKTIIESKNTRDCIGTYPGGAFSPKII